MKNNFWYGFRPYSYKNLLNISSQTDFPVENFAFFVFVFALAGHEPYDHADEQRNDEADDEPDPPGQKRLLGVVVGGTEHLRGLESAKIHHEGVGVVGLNGRKALRQFARLGRACAPTSEKVKKLHLN